MRPRWTRGWALWPLWWSSAAHSRWGVGRVGRVGRGQPWPGLRGGEWGWRKHGNMRSGRSKRPECALAAGCAAGSQVGQSVVVGCEWGKVRSLRGAGGAAVEEVLPGQPAEISGLKGLPQAGDELLVSKPVAQGSQLRPLAYHCLLGRHGAHMVACLLLLLRLSMAPAPELLNLPQWHAGGGQRGACTAHEPLPHCQVGVPPARRHCAPGGGLAGTPILSAAAA